MITLMIPSHLSDLLPDDAQIIRTSLTRVSLQPGSWEVVVQEIRERFPRLARRVLTESGSLTSGFALAVNNEIVSRDYDSLVLRSGDEFSIVAAMAGG